MRVAQVMTRDVAACESQDTAHTAARLMWENDCGCVPVLNGSSVIGIVTDRDLCMAAYLQGKLLQDIPVSVAMSRPAALSKPEDTIQTAEQIMTENKVRRLPVIDAKDRLVGILSLNDIAREAARERTQRGKEVTDAEVGETLSVLCEPRAAP